MSKKSLDEEREFCRGVYKKWDFVRGIVELYAEGISWRGCDLTGVDAIKDGVRSLLVTGMGDFNLKSQNGMQAISVEMPSNLNSEEPGHPFLWPVTQNAMHLDEIEKLIGLEVYENEMFQMLARDMCLGLGVPYELLEPLGATADGNVIMWGLTSFRGNVKTWRDYLGSRLGVSWNETWFLSGLAAYGPVYQVFNSQGIELRMLAQQVLSAANIALDGWLISRQTYNESAKWFL